MELAPRISIFMAFALAASGSLLAQEHQEHQERQAHQEHQQGRPEAHGEAHSGPSRYQRVTEPQHWNERPNTVDRGHYEHNFQASRSYHIGAYRHPRGWVSRRWAHGETLPRAYWTPSYIVSDYWLFALEVPPEGYEWVRDDTDAILVNVATGQILQVEYGVFG